MDKLNKLFDIGIIGAGLAGLVSSIHLAKMGKSVVLLEKSSFPRHKVCGEYISNEVYDYLLSLGLDVYKLGAVDINQFRFTAENGKSIESDLKMGGFGISRYTIDHALWQLAKDSGVACIIDEVLKVEKAENYALTAKSKDVFNCKLLIGAQGKRSKIDKHFNRAFIKTRTPWIGVKAHYEYENPESLVSLHHFKGGYCGVSSIENQRVNACYLVHQSIFNACNSMDEFQEKILSRNPFLKEFFNKATMVFDRPLSISQVYFGDRAKSMNGVFFIGDAAGMIHPLAGNGMAIAIHSGKLISELLIRNYDDQRTINWEKSYQTIWRDTFKKRLKNGAIIHKLLENSKLSNSLMNVLPYLPFVLPPIIRKTHGENVGRMAVKNDI